jgi:Ca2+-binding EF-hand superfamily protein
MDLVNETIHILCEALAEEIGQQPYTCELIFPNGVAQNALNPDDALASVLAPHFEASASHSVVSSVQGTDMLSIDDEHAVSAVEECLKTLGTPDVLSAFQQYDIDKSGAIDETELQSMLKTLGRNSQDRAHLDFILQRADLDKDGQLNYAEFVRWLLYETDTSLFDDDLVKQLFGTSQKENCAMDYRAKDGERIFVPVTRKSGKLLLRAGGTFSYVANARARFFEGVQGQYTLEGPKASLTATNFGPLCHAQNLDPVEITVTLGSEGSDFWLGVGHKGCHAVMLPAGASGSWLDPSDTC